MFESEKWVTEEGGRDKVHPPLLVRNGAWAFGCSGGGFGIFSYIMAQFISDMCREQAGSCRGSQSCSVFNARKPQWGEGDRS